MTQQNTSDAEMIEKARKRISDLCKGDRWLMSIPVQKTDDDELFSWLCDELEKRISPKPVPAPLYDKDFCDELDRLGVKFRVPADDAKLRDPIWAHVKKIEEENEKLSFDLGTIRATLLVNFGPQGRQKPLVTGDEPTILAMMMKVLEDAYTASANHDEKVRKLEAEEIAIPKSLWEDIFRCIAGLNERPLFSSVERQMIDCDENLREFEEGK